MDKTTWVSFKKDNKSDLIKIKIFITTMLLLISVFQGLYFYFVKSSIWEVIYIIINEMFSLILVQGVLAIINRCLSKKNNASKGIIYNIPWKKAINFQLILCFMYYILIAIKNYLSTKSEMSKVDIILGVLLIPIILLSIYFDIRLFLCPILFWEKMSFREALVAAFKISRNKGYMRSFAKMVVLPFILLMCFSIAFYILERYNILFNIDESLFSAIRRFIPYFTVYVLLGYFPKGAYYYYRYVQKAMIKK